MTDSSQPVGMLSRVVRTLCGIAVWSLVVILSLLFVVLGINAFDERLAPEAVALLQPPANPYSPDQNVYLSFVGFDGQSGQSVTAIGEARVAHYNGLVDKMFADPMLGLAETAPEDPQRLKFVGSVEFCRMQDPLLWEIVRTNGSNVHSLIEQNGELYRRYLALLDLPGYYETARPGVSPPIPLGTVSEARKLFLADVILGLQSGDKDATQTALQRLRQDVGLWRRVLVGQGAMISKMIALAYLQTDSWLLVDMFADPRTYIPADMDTYLPDLKLEDWNIGNAFHAEFRFHDFLYRQARAAVDSHWQPAGTSRAQRGWNSRMDPTQGLLFKFNATENLSAKLMNDLARFAVLDQTSEFAASQARFKTWEQVHTDLFSIRTIYNPVGKVLIYIAVPAYGDYLLRPYDTDAVQRLVRLSFEVRRQHIVTAAIPAFMHQHPEWSTHPADGHTFLWEPVKGEITIQPVAKRLSSGRRFSAHLWQ